MTAITAYSGRHKHFRARPDVARTHSRRLTLIRGTGFTVLGLQAAAFVVWSTVLCQHFALTFDFSIYQQACFEIAHGNLNPVVSMVGVHFWQNHCELITWAFALLYWVWPHSVTLLWIQDLCLAAAEITAFIWMCEIAEQRESVPGARWLPLAGLILLVGNPWIWWAISWDYHTEAAATLFAVLLSRSLYHRQPRYWIWLVCLIACGDVACTYLAGIGLGALLVGRRRSGLTTLAAGIGVLLFITLIHGNDGSVLNAYSYLASTGASSATLTTGEMVQGILRHPANVVNALWAKRQDLWASTASSGLLGLGFGCMLPLTCVVLAANNLFAGLLFAAPGFQTLPVYVLLPVGTIAVATWLLARARWIAWPLLAASLALALGYSIVWLPQVPGHWLRVPASTAASLSGVLARIPGSAEVIASQGIMGRFSAREDVQAIFGSGPLKLRGGDTWVVVVPSYGEESESPSSAMRLVSYLAGPMHAKLEAASNGVWAFQFNATGNGTLNVPSDNGSIQAWTTAGKAGRAMMNGPSATWHVAATGQPGYIAAGMEWEDQPGSYVAGLTFAAAGPVNVEVWNDSCGTLLARRTPGPTTGITRLVIPVQFTTACENPLYEGSSIFRAAFLPAPTSQHLEIRVWSPGHEQVSVYTASLVVLRIPRSASGQFRPVSYRAPGSGPRPGSASRARPTSRRTRTWAK